MKDQFMPADVLNKQIKARGEALRAAKAQREASRVVEDQPLSPAQVQDELEKMHDKRYGVERKYNPVSDKLNELKPCRRDDFIFFDMPTADEIKYAGSGLRFYCSGHAAGRSKVSLEDEKLEKHSEVRIVYMEGL